MPTDSEFYLQCLHCIGDKQADRTQFRCQHLNLKEKKTTSRIREGEHRKD